MPIHAGSKTEISPGVTDFPNSMAAAMENAFMKEWPLIMKTSAPESNDQLRLIFIAVAQGLVKYLQDNTDAFGIAVSGGTGSLTINTAGPLHT